jgi:hypothetical protein
MGLSLALPSK